MFPPVPTSLSFQERMPLPVAPPAESSAASALANEWTEKASLLREQATNNIQQWREEAGQLWDQATDQFQTVATTTLPQPNKPSAAIAPRPVLAAIGAFLGMAGLALGNVVLAPFTMLAGALAGIGVADMVNQGPPQHWFGHMKRQIQSQSEVGLIPELVNQFKRLFGNS
ncbi:MAG: hypothetical protein SFZ03_05360 [Candidatus Melainabacteria bacterium]|nr:hypothetical protein [Candidatus Melainabacteria bacterium]